MHIWTVRGVFCHCSPCPDPLYGYFNEDYGVSGMLFGRYGAGFGKLRKVRNVWFFKHDMLISVNLDGFWSVMGYVLAGMGFLGELLLVGNRF